VKNKRSEPSDPLLDFGAREIIKLVLRLNRTDVGRYIGRQLTCSGISVDANYKEAYGAESHADFIYPVR